MARLRYLSHQNDSGSTLEQLQVAQAMFGFPFMVIYVPDEAALVLHQGTLMGTDIYFYIPIFTNM